MEAVYMYIRRIVYGSAATLLLLVGVWSPLQAYADDPASDCSPVQASNGVQQPTGSDAKTYTYNACTGLWENAHYTWNPDTKSTTPRTPYVYTYNASSGAWDAQKWTYSPAGASWYQATFSVAQPPAGSQTIGGPEPKAEVLPESLSSVANGGVTDNATTTQSTSSTTQTTLHNTITSTATSGNVLLSSNTLSGHAASGDVLAMANVINLLQSSSSIGAGTAVFMANVDGDVWGDLVIDPNMLQPAQANNSLNSTSNIDVTIANNGEIVNDIKLIATSGDVVSSRNTTTGDATSGNAQAMASVVNMMNTMVASSQSFLGVVNINGNLNGNIVMPQEFLDTLLASNAPKTTIDVSQEAIMNATTNIANNVTSRADSGAVTASRNTTAGNATSGTATTDVTVFDLSNSHVVGANTMLVFVNVLGTWVGVIMDAPAGSTAAALGGGIRQASVNNDSSVNANSTGKITNNIDVAARSGDVTSSQNTTAGNARSGDAHTSVSIANISNSTLSLGGWFGILFINVHGTWNGSFGIMKEGADPATNVPIAAQEKGGVFDFVPAAFSKTTSLPEILGLPSGDFADGGEGINVLTAMQTAAVLGATDIYGLPAFAEQVDGSDSGPAIGSSWDMAVIGSAVLLIGLMIGGADFLRHRGRL